MKHMLPPAPLIPAAFKAPTPLAVTALTLTRTPKQQLDDMYHLDDAERELARHRGPLDVEDHGDREELLGIHAAAVKQLARVPARVGSHLTSLS